MSSDVATGRYLAATGANYDPETIRQLTAAVKAAGQTYGELAETLSESMRLFAAAFAALQSDDPDEPTWIDAMRCSFE